MSDNKTTFSIIIDTHDQAEDLKHILPILLSQQYEGYEVIVVDERSADETTDYIHELQSVYPHLYATFLPLYHFQKKRRRLAFTIGVKAAKYDWLVFADFTLSSLSDQWLNELSASLQSSTTLVLGYVSKKTGSVSLRTYEDLSQAEKIISKAERWRYGIGHDQWLKSFQKRMNYDFIAVRREHGHELLRSFSQGVLSLSNKE